MPERRDPRAAPATSPTFDRVHARRSRATGRRDVSGTEALYSTAPDATPTAHVELRCRRCDTRFGSSLVGLARLLVPPFLADPVRRRLWARCPACARRAWLDVEAGQKLRIWIDRRP